MYPQPRAHGRRTLGLLVAGWAILALVSLWWGIPHIQEHLGGDARAALDEQGLLGVQATFSGRDAELSGVVGRESEITRAIAAVEGLWGVRVATAQITVDSEEPDDAPESAPTTVPERTGPTSPTVSITPTAGGVVLEGIVASQVTAAAINATAAAAYGQAVDDRLTVDPGVGEPGWTADIATLLRGVGAIGGELEISEGTLRVSGLVFDETTRTMIVNELTGLDPGLSIDNQIEIDPIADRTRFAIDSRPGGVVLRGVVDAEETVDRLIDAGEQIYGIGRVQSALAIDATTDLDSYVKDPDDLFQALEGRRLDLIVTDDGVYLRGVVPNDAVSDSVAATVEKLVAPAPVVNELMVVEADPETTAAAQAINDIIGTSLTFDTGSAELTAEAAGRLDEVATILMGRPELAGVVAGHTDDVGSAADNLALSEARARAVVDYLVAAGVDEERLSAIGFGETRPVSTNSTAEGRAANRRIEFQVEGSV